MDINKDLVEGLKQVVRIAILAALPILVTALSSPLGVDWGSVGLAMVIAVLSGLDKWNHEAGNKTPLDLKGMDALK